MIATLNYRDIKFDDDMAVPLSMSAVFHIVIIIIAIVGLPHVKPELPVIENSIAVEILDIAEKTESNNIQKPVPSEKIKAAENQAKKKKPMPPKMDAKTPPKPMMTKAPKLNDDVAMPRDAEELKPDDNKARIAKAPKPPLKKPKMTASQEENQDDFQKILRNLQESTPESSEEQNKKITQGAKPSLISSFSDRMTISEQSALRKQLSMCWNVAAGAKFAEDIIVELKLFVNPNRIVTDTRIVDQLRYNRDSFFRASTDSALRAVRHPRCTPLDLPVDKYNQWKEITVTFDPRNML